MRGPFRHFSDTRAPDVMSMEEAVMRRAPAHDAAQRHRARSSFTLGQRALRLSLTTLAIVLASLFFAWQLHATLH